MIKAEQINYEYFRRDGDGNVTEIVEAVHELSLHVQKGEFLAILGSNGSGKSTFAKMVNALIEPTEGTILVAGMNTADESLRWSIRKEVGMVFQNPDNQIVGSMVEEDVAFGLENTGVPGDDMIERVSDSLEALGMTAYRTKSPNHLSGGQKQRMTIAGVLAMQPKCIIFDEATAMLDPGGRREVLKAAKMLNQERGITILYITHEMDEVIAADRVIVLHKGKLVIEDTPEKLFLRGEELKQYGLVVPKITEVAMAVHSAGIDFRENVLSVEEFVSEVNRVKAYHNADRIQLSRTHPEEGYVGNASHRDSKKDTTEDMDTQQLDAATHGLLLDRVGFDYAPKTVYSHKVLNNVQLGIQKGEFAAIIGHTGSGKSTLIQHFNGLLRPTEGTIYYKGQDIYEKGYDRTKLRGNIGMVFQYPEHQLFADTVLEDVCFGPKNLGLPLLEIQKNAFDAIQAVGLDDSIYDLSPFELSGGQQRRVAIAGVLAMKPEILVLDEPVAGLDPIGRIELLTMLKNLNDNGMTIILVSHSMDDVAEYAGRVIVMDHGTVVKDGSVDYVFGNEKELLDLGLDVPVVHHLMTELKRNGHEVAQDVYCVKDAIRAIIDYIQK